MNNLDRIKHLRAQDYGVAGLSTTDVDWLIAEVERLTAERDRFKRIVAEANTTLTGIVGVSPKYWEMPRDQFCEEFVPWAKSRAKSLLDLIAANSRQPLKENE